MVQEITNNLAGYAPLANGLIAANVERPAAEELLSRAVIVSLQTGRLGNSKKIRQSEVTRLETTGEDGQDRVVIDRTKKTDLLKLTKKLLQSSTLEAIVSHDGKTRQTLLRKWCLPSFAQAGFYFVPIDLVSEVDTYLARRKQSRQELVDSFVGEYRDLRELARQENPFYREKDYPAESDIAGKFTWFIRYLSLGTPTNLQEIDAALYQREADGLADMWRQAAREVEEALTEAMMGLFDHAVEKLSFQSNGKPMIFRDSLVENMNEFLNLFDKRNITGSIELAALAGQARQLMAGVDPATLRFNLGARDRIRNGFMAIQQTMDSMLVDRPVRAIDLDD